MAFKIDLDKIKDADFQTEDEGRITAQTIKKRRMEAQEQEKLPFWKKGFKKKEDKYMVETAKLNSHNLYAEMDRVEDQYIKDELSRRKRENYKEATFGIMQEVLTVICAVVLLAVGYFYVTSHTNELSSATESVAEKANDIVDSSSSNAKAKQALADNNE